MTEDSTSEGREGLVPKEEDDVYEWNVWERGWRHGFWWFLSFTCSTGVDGQMETSRRYETGESRVVIRWHDLYAVVSPYGWDGTVGCAEHEPMLLRLGKDSSGL